MPSCSEGTAACVGTAEGCVGPSHGAGGGGRSSGRLRFIRCRCGAEEQAEAVFQAELQGQGQGQGPRVSGVRASSDEILCKFSATTRFPIPIKFHHSLYRVSAAGVPASSLMHALSCHIPAHCGCSEAAGVEQVALDYFASKKVFEDKLISLLFLVCIFVLHHQCRPNVSAS